MVRECKGICENEYLYGIKVFSKKRLPYNKASYCKECEVSVRPPSVDKIIVTRKGEREEFPDKIKVECPCCGTVCRGHPHTKPKAEPKLISKSYKELGLSKTPTRGTPKLKRQLNEWLERFDSQYYENKLDILKDYDYCGGLRLTDDGQTRPIDSFILLLDEVNKDKQRQLYIRKFLKLLDKFARKHKLGMNGMTQEEQDIEATKRLYEGIKRQLKATASSQFVPIVDIIEEEDKEEDGEAEGKESNIDN
jgi:hypothetical protein